MPNEAETQRIAAAMHALRPEWRIDSLRTFLTRNHGNRPYQDLAIAGTVVALDTDTKTPELLNKHGRWWAAAQAAFADGTTPTVGPGKEPRCEVYGHDTMPARTCPGCRTEHLTTGTWPAGTRHQEAGHQPAEPDAKTRAAGDYGDDR